MDFLGMNERVSEGDQYDPFPLYLPPRLSTVPPPPGQVPGTPPPTTPDPL